MYGSPAGGAINVCVRIADFLAIYAIFAGLIFRPCWLRHEYLFGMCVAMHAVRLYSATAAW